MRQHVKGFSLIEVMLAIIVTVGISMIVFQLFQQNERLFRDQNLIIEMQQSARVVASQIADEVRMAGQGVPIYAASFDRADNEAVGVILSSSTNNRIDFRAGLSNVETNAVGARPSDFTLGISRSLSVGDGSQFSNALGTTSPRGRFVYVSGPTNDSKWAWVRAELTNSSANTLTLTPWQAGDAGRLAGVDLILGNEDDVVRFTQSPTVSLEEVVSLYLSGNTIKRATASDMTNLTNPTWSAANEIGRNFTLLEFTYHDRNDTVVLPNSLVNRASIARVDVRVASQTASALSNGAIPIYPLSFRTIPRNMRVR